ncbi:hypothetical protein [Streptomyces sp. NPDC002587]
MPADRLRELLDAGLGTHDQHPPGPATCSRTPHGRSLLPSLEQIRTWARHRTT